jgi:hypothetical protein
MRPVGRHRSRSQPGYFAAVQVAAADQLFHDRIDRLGDGPGESLAITPEGDGALGRKRLLSRFQANALQVLARPYEPCPGQARPAAPDHTHELESVIRRANQQVDNPCVAQILPVELETGDDPLAHTRTFWPYVPWVTSIG